MNRFVTLLLIFITACLNLASQVFELDSSFSKEYLNKQVLYLYIDTSDKSIENIIDSVFQLRFQDINRNNFFRPGEHVVYWFKLDLQNVDNEMNCYFLEIQNPDINELQYFIVRKDSVERSMVTGDFFPFQHRLFNNRKFIWKFGVEKDEQVTIYVKINNHGEPLVAPFRLFSEERYMQALVKENLGNGFYFGTMIMFILLAFVIWLLIKNRLNLYYAVYLVCLFFFLISTRGYGYQFFWSNSPFFRNIDELVFIGLVCIMSLLFELEFLDIKKHSRFLTRLIWGIVFFTFFLILLVPLTMGDSINQVLLLLTLTMYMTIGVSVVVIAAYISFKYRKNAYFLYFSVYLMVVVGLFFYYLDLLSLVRDNPLFRNVAFYVAYIEMLIFSSYLTFKFHVFRKEQFEVQRELARQKHKATYALMQGEENERKRLSLELHDGIGLMLSVIRNKLAGIIESTKMKNKDCGIDTILQDIDIVNRDIRLISHNLSPMSLQTDGLSAAIKSTIDSVNRVSEGIRFLYNPPEEPLVFEDTAKETTLFRIFQELMNNAIKYSQAKKVHVVLSSDADDYMLQLMDDGVGFDLKDTSNAGIGLKNIESRLQIFNGTISVESQNEYGTLITVSVPK
jgi:signal transduction histidine kinase